MNRSDEEFDQTKSMENEQTVIQNQLVTLSSTLERLRKNQPATFLKIKHVLTVSGGNKTQAAKTLQIDHNTLLTQLKQSQYVLKS